MATALVLAPGMVFAQAAAPLVRVTRANDGAVVVSAQTDALLVTQVIGRSAFTLTTSTGVDRVRVTANEAGDVVIDRNGAAHAFQVRRATDRDIDATRDLLDASPAMAALEVLVASEWAQTSVQALPLLSAHALVSLLQGRPRPPIDLSARLGPAGPPRLTRVRSGQPQSPNGCWETYQRDVLQITYDYEQCFREATYSLDFTRTMWCAYSYNFRASLAFIWLVECSGV